MTGKLTVVVVVLIALGALEGVPGHTQDATLKKASKHVDITYPRRISIPDSIPSVQEVRSKTPDAGPLIVLPVVRYLEGHYFGWQSCLKECGLKPIPEETPSKGGSAGSSDTFSWMGQKQGYNDCAAVLLSHIGAGVSIEDLKTACAESYRPLPGITPPPPQEIEQSKSRQ